MGLFDRVRRTFAATIQQSTGSTLGGGKPKPFTLPVKAPVKHETAADRLDFACKQHKATYQIRREGEDVIVRILLQDGDTVVSGRGSNTPMAVAEALAKLEKIQA